MGRTTILALGFGAFLVVGFPLAMLGAREWARNQASSILGRESRVVSSEFRFEGEEGVATKPQGNEVTRRQGEEVAYQLVEGWNEVRLSDFPDGVERASDMLVAIAEQGDYATTVTYWDGDRWVDYSQRGAVGFGEDYALKPDQVYRVWVAGEGK